MQPLSAQLVGPDEQLLVVHLPSRFTDEWIGPVEQEVASRLPRLAGAGLILDFRSVLIMNSIAITCLLHLQDTCRARQAKMILAGLPDTIAKFLAQLKLDRRFTIAPSVDDATALLLTPRTTA